MAPPASLGLANNATALADLLAAATQTTGQPAKARVTVDLGRHFRSIELEDLDHVAWCVVWRALFAARVSLYRLRLSGPARSSPSFSPRPLAKTRTFTRTWTYESEPCQSASRSEAPTVRSPFSSPSPAPPRLPCGFISFVWCQATATMRPRRLETTRGVLCASWPRPSRKPTRSKARSRPPRMASSLCTPGWPPFRSSFPPPFSPLPAPRLCSFLVLCAGLRLRSVSRAAHPDGRVDVAHVHGPSRRREDAGETQATLLGDHL